MSGVPAGGNTWKNIAIGILTTVVAYFIVHKIFENMDKKKEEKKVREANLKVWSSINSYKSSVFQKLQTLSCFSCDYGQMRDEMIREFDQVSKSLNNLKNESLIDERMKTILDRTIGTFTDMKPAYQVFFDSMIPLRALPDSVQTGSGVHIQENFSKRIKYIATRDTLEINERLRSMEEDFDVEFGEMKPLYEFEPAVLTRFTWNIECKILMKLHPDGTVSWTQNEKTNTGKWSRRDENLIITLNDGNTYSFTIVHATLKSMLLAIPGTPSVMAACPESTGNSE
jgi:hypothetical protein